MTAPLVSIITPSFHQARYLPETLACVARQTYRPIEHIIVDGASTDGSLDILRAAAGIRWVSEPDKGQADAINKGFRMATGDILAWLNSDDTLFPDTVECVVSALERTGADLVYGDLEITNDAGQLLKMCWGIPFDYRTLLYGIDYIGQQTVFFRRSLLEKAGPLRTEFDNSFDYELWLRMSAHGRFAYDPAIRARIRVHADAKSVARVAVTHADNARIRAEYWPRGGWPRLFGLPGLFLIPNYFYRLKRQLNVRRHENPHRP